MCDCTIGYLVDEFVKISNIYEKLNEIAEHQQRLKKAGLLANKEPDSPREIIDGRKGYLQKFTFCPECGYKINWKQIIKELER